MATPDEERPNPHAELEAEGFPAYDTQPGTLDTDEVIGDLVNDVPMQVPNDGIGRLVDPENELGDDLTKETVAGDVGRDDGDFSAEEAAMHVIEEP